MKIKEFIQGKIDKRKSAIEEKRRVFKDIISRSGDYAQALGIKEEDIGDLQSIEPIVRFKIDGKNFELDVMAVTPSESGEAFCRFCIIARCSSEDLINTCLIETRGGILEPFPLITSDAWHQRICAYLSSGEAV